METVKITNCTARKSKDGKKTFYQLQLADGRKPTGWEDLTNFVGQEIQLDITQNEAGYWNYKKPQSKKDEIIELLREVIKMIKEL